MSTALPIFFQPQAQQWPLKSSCAAGDSTFRIEGPFSEWYKTQRAPREGRKGPLEHCPFSDVYVVLWGASSKSLCSTLGCCSGQKDSSENHTSAVAESGGCYGLTWSFHVFLHVSLERGRCDRLPLGGAIEVKNIFRAKAHHLPCKHVSGENQTPHLRKFQLSGKILGRNGD